MGYHVQRNPEVGQQQQHHGRNRLADVINSNSGSASVQPGGVAGAAAEQVAGVAGAARVA